MEAWGEGVSTSEKLLSNLTKMQELTEERARAHGDLGRTTGVTARTKERGRLGGRVGAIKSLDVPDLQEQP